MSYAIRSISALVVIGGVALAAGCDGDNDAKMPAATQSLPAGLFVQAPIDGAKDVEALKGTAAGTEVVVRARVGGVKAPLMDNRAVANIMDVSAQTCDQIEGDKCPTPWDACCAQKTVATLQVLGADGKPLHAGLNGANGIAPGKQIIAAGKVHDAGQGSLVINATRIYVVP